MHHNRRREGHSLTVYRAGCLAVFGLLSLIAPSWGAMPGSQVSFNYRITATLTLGDKVFTGSSVWRMSARKQPTVGGDRTVYEVHGEAVALTHGTETLLMLRRDAKGFSTLAYGAFPRFCDKSSKAPILEKLAAFAGPCSIRSVKPEIVSFSNPNDPTTLLEFPYGNLEMEECNSNCLAITVERTDDPVTTGLENRLPWLKLGTIVSEVGTDITPKNGALLSLPGRFNNIDFSTEVHWAAR